MDIRVLASVILGIVLTTLGFGCGGANPNAPASVSGSIKYKGKPVTGGTVQYVTKEGTAYSAPIDGDGTYSISDIPVGELVVTVETESVNPDKKLAGGSGKDAAKYKNMAAGQESQKPPSDRGGGNAGPAVEGTASGDKTKYVKIPESYSKAKTSPLTKTVKQGRQVIDVELE